MIFKFYEPHNPKLDYLICRNIIGSIPRDYDEYEIRDCYKGKIQPKEKYQEELVDLKRFFSHIEQKYDESYIEKFIEKFCFNIDVNIDKINMIILSCDTIVNKLIKIINDLDFNNQSYDRFVRYIVFIILLLDTNKLVIPYLNHIKKIIYTIKYGCGENEINRLISLLVDKSNKFYVKHPLELNEYILRSLSSNKREFIKKLQCENLAIMGSFAVGNPNEYSDLDLIVIMKNDYDEIRIKNETIKYWNNYFVIPMDVKVLKMDEFDHKLTLGMKKTFKII